MGLSTRQAVAAYRPDPSGVKAHAQSIIARMPDDAQFHFSSDSRLDMTVLSCAQVLAGQAPKDAQVTIKGWVRTRRDSKAGISFVNISDGSSFHPVQAVAPNTLSNYTDEVLRLTAGCAVEATGRIVPSPAKGQPFELQATAIKVIGWVEDPDSYPIQPKPHSFEFLREVAHLRPRTNVIGAVTRVRHAIAQSIHRFFHENGFLWVNTPIITSSDAEGAGELFRVSTLDLMDLPRTPDGKIDFSQDFFGARSVSHRFRAIECRGLLPRHVQGLHLRPHVPRGELEHQPPSRGVLDDRARDRIRQSCGRCDTGRSAAQAHLQDRVERARRRHGVFRGAHREGCDRQAAGHRRHRIRAHGLHRGHRDPGAKQGAHSSSR